MPCPDHQGSALFSPCGTHRLRLDRWWSDEPRALVAGANPSKAGAERQDATIHRLFDLLYGRPGIGGFTMMNFSTYIATDPADHERWAGAQSLDDLRAWRTANLERIREISATAAVRIVAWGTLVAGLHANRVMDAMSLDGQHALYAFALTNAGQPKHPSARGTHRIASGQPFVMIRPALARAATAREGA